MLSPKMVCAKRAHKDWIITVVFIYVLSFIVGYFSSSCKWSYLSASVFCHTLHSGWDCTLFSKQVITRHILALLGTACTEPCLIETEVEDSRTVKPFIIQCNTFWILCFCVHIGRLGMVATRDGCNKSYSFNQKYAWRSYRFCSVKAFAHQVCIFRMFF